MIFHSSVPVYPQSESLPATHSDAISSPHPRHQHGKDQEARIGHGCRPASRGRNMVKSMVHGREREIYIYMIDLYTSTIY